MSCAYALWDGAYVVGALSPAERDEYEAHLSGCPACRKSVRELAGLPGLLARVETRTLEEPLEPVPPTLLPRLVRAVRRERRRRVLLGGGVAAAAAVVAVLLTVGAVSGIGALVGTDDPGPEAAGPPAAGSPTAGSPTAGSPTAGSPPAAPSRVMQRVGDAPLEGWLTLETVPWGTRITLRCNYRTPSGQYGVPAATGYVLVVRTRDGDRQQAATWTAEPGRSVELSAATATDRASIAAVEVRTEDGRPLLRLRG